MGGDCAHSVNHLFPKYEGGGGIIFQIHAILMVSFAKLKKKKKNLEKKIPVEGACTRLCMHVCHNKPQM